jgi:hypothetical protein
MDTSKVFAPVVSDIARRFHADKIAEPKAKLSAEQLGL